MCEKMARQVRNAKVSASALHSPAATMTPNPRQSTQNVTAGKSCGIASEIRRFDGDLGGLGELIAVHSAGILGTVNSNL